MNGTPAKKKLICSLRGLASVILVIACAFLIHWVILLLSGKSPARIYFILFKGAFGGVYNFARSIRWAVPLIFTALSFAVSERCGIFNIGAEGQLYMGAFAAAWVGFTFPDLPHIALVLLAMAAAMIAGMLWSMAAAWLTLRFHASVIVVTLMLNYIAILFTEYLTRYPFYVPGTLGESGSTQFVSDGARLTTLIFGTDVTTGALLALAAAAAIAFWSARTVTGYECRIIGANERFAAFSGLMVTRRKLLVFAVSGMLAGLGGAVEVLGNYGRFMVNFASGLGFDGIVVSLLAGGNPALIPVSALFMGAMNSGSISVEMFGGVPKAMTDILMGVIVVIVTVRAIPVYIRRRPHKTAAAQK
ncbi:ABC transporter permease [Anaerotruncus colihominis]|uniref:ABC transporter permease n=1 Tax=Anaerotruncus colihominis TaxID=169435 RepID=A0A845RNI4_9FIRM|nr:ABC transporter permease [Anaerotruncus colihominis]NBI79222.1 ABC transporter permease [Anaerotruncus colihominis]